MADYIGSIIAATLNNVKEARKVHDQIFEQRLLLKLLKEKGRVQGVGGGLNIVQTLQCKANDSVAFRDPYAKIPVRQQDPLTRVSYPWASINGAVPVFGFDDVVNSGEEAIVNFAEELRQNLVDTLADTIGPALYSDGSDEWGIQGLQAIVDNDNTYPVANDKQQIPGINRAIAGNEYWRANVLATSEPWSLDGGTDGGWARAYKLATGGQGVDHPDLILCDWNTFSWYEAVLIGMKQIIEHDEVLADAGFQNLRYHNAVVAWDDDIETLIGSGCTFFLNTKYLRLRPHQKNVDRFVFETAKQTEDYDPGTYVVKAVWRGQMTCTRPARFTRYSAKTAPI